jgi:pyruvate dehydrogenase E1 component beta subunit
MLVAALRAARLLLARGIEAEVIDLRYLAPLDLETVRRSLFRTHRALVIEEGETFFAPTVAAAVAEAAFDELDAPVGVIRVPAGAATLAEALDRALPAIVTQTCWLLGRPAQIGEDGDYPSPTPQ